MIKIQRGDKNQIAIFLGIAFGVLCILSCFSVAFCIPTIIVTPMMLCMISYYTKSIEIDQSGCKIKTFLLKRSFAWSDFQTIRMQNFSQQYSSKNQMCYFSDRGILFSTHKIREYPLKKSPDDYFLFHDPLSRTGFYLQFDPTAECAKRLNIKNYSSFPYRADWWEFMSMVEEWGLKIEGLNVPMPPEQLAAKKKR